MTPRGLLVLAWSLFAIFLAAGFIGAGLEAASGKPQSAIPGVASAVFPLVGMMILQSRPSHRVGWLLLFQGGSVLVLLALLGYVDHSLVLPDPRLPVIDPVTHAWFWAQMLPAVLGFWLVPLFFPDGRLPSPRWRPVAWFLVGSAAFLMLWMAFTPGLHIYPPTPVRNPYAIQALPPLGEPPWGQFLFTFMLLLALPGVAAQVIRFRRSAGVERQQVKWFFYSASVLPFVLAVTFLSHLNPAVGPVLDLLWFLAFLAYPLAIGVAILRHQLYDIDVLINRTLVYGLLTAGLALGYWGSVVLLQRVLQPFTQGSELAIVGSTLIVAALFQPARGRIQAAVDRRFYRQKYDAARTLEAFSQRLREQVDLDSLNAELRTIVRRTMQPAHVSLWLWGRPALTPTLAQRERGLPPEASRG